MENDGSQGNGGGETGSDSQNPDKQVDRWREDSQNGLDLPADQGTSSGHQWPTKQEKPTRIYAFEFNGQSLEYFRIWIVNLLLTVVTLGIYSAWAKVRSNRYFYGNTAVDGSAFNYTADPVNILKGRLFAVALLILYQFCIRFLPSVAGYLLIVFVLMVPAIYVLNMSFRMRYTSWRGMNFSFQKDFSGAYRLFSPLVIYFVLVTFAPALFDISDEVLVEPTDESGQLVDDLIPYMIFIFAVGLGAMLLFPLWQRFYYQFMGNRVNYGKSSFEFSVGNWTIYRIYLIAFVIFISGFILYVVAIAFSAGFAPEGLEGGLISTLVLSFVPMLLAYLLAYSYVQTRLTNVIYSNIVLEDIRFESRLKFGRMSFLYITNTLAILFTVGLAIPWSKIRMARYRAESMFLYCEDIQNFVAEPSGEVNAGADAISDLFDLDIGL